MRFARLILIDIVSIETILSSPKLTNVSGAEDILHLMHPITSLLLLEDGVEEQRDWAISLTSNQL